jgi:hypothetical protein
LEKKQEAYENDVKMISQRMFRSTAGKDVEPASKVTKYILTVNLISVARDSNVLNI